MSNINYHEEQQCFRDEHGNVSTIMAWVSKEYALRALKSLVNCKNCTDCSHCNDCINCTDCNFLNQSNDCTSCGYSSLLAHCDNCHYCNSCSVCVTCNTCEFCVDCIGLLGVSRCKLVRSETITGRLGTYRYWITKHRARIGCQEHFKEEWLAFSKEELCKMSLDACIWYDKYWEAWVALLSIPLDDL